ncbi:porin family protein [Nibrella saemangeumensis]
MKKVNLMGMALGLLLTSQVLAQDVHLGLKAGVNAYNTVVADRNTGGKLAAVDYKPGFHVGGLAHIHLSPRWAVQPELMYSGQGGRQTVSGVETRWNTNYINVPILAQFMFGDGFRVQAGPQIGFLTSAKMIREGNTSNVTQNYNPIDAGLATGLSYVGATGLGVDARWVFGLTNINKGTATTYTRNNGAQVGIFYLLNYHR